MDNELKSAIQHSGNSDVDIEINIDTVSMAYMYACSLLATDRIDEHQFNRMIEQYHRLMKNHHHDKRTPVRERAEDERTKVKLLRPSRRLSR
ncbi:hypothetical protein DCC39_04620 [Pueribacillus theae]|uniref:Uncharacterized protein n=1 Tax=Pueribacillus theae TaxID=2171751 RepID=A0A2U1K6Y9_9BACI|nr:hypothetical protein [Pueribacillus theae]PWA12723.1 hypothetical protein DCC39_04620 [Pueribacillus theae]